MRVVPVPLLADNYAYVVVADDGQTTAIVDPSEGDGVIAVLAKLGLEPSMLWLTHHHWDHVGGVEALVARFPELVVVASAYDGEHVRVPRQGKRVDDADSFSFASHKVRVLAIPGHTLGAVGYWVEGELFTGDTLFLAGCGRMFEGTPDMMSASLLKLRALPAETRIWCGHEYTQKNLEFAAKMEPGNEAVGRALERVRGQRAKNEPSVPWSLAEDRDVNPFLRFDRPELSQGLPNAESFARLRGLKDHF